jgi:hypothetical protein
MKTQQEKLKRQIVTLIKQSGLPVRTQYIANQVALPTHLILNELLSELVAERRLSRSYTLLANGDPECTYDLKF